MSTRLGEIKSWLVSLSPDFDMDSLQYLQSDASARKYLRVQENNASRIIMDTQPGLELDRFISIAGLLRENGLNAPQIIANDSARGLLLMNDFGSKTYMSELTATNQTNTNKLYLDALIALTKIQRISINDQQEMPLMDANYISNRLEVFTTWYLQRHLGLELGSKINYLLGKMQDLFIDVFSSQPQVLVHLDYHSRNLMVVEPHNPGILDFQDAMIGPASYDLVSLLQDAYLYLPRSEVEAWVKTFGEINVKISLRDFDLVGLQRHIKNLGVFARLHHRDQKSNYLHDMPMLIKYITETCGRYSELSWLLDFVTEMVGLE